MLGNIFFVVIEYINLHIQGAKDYFADPSNIADYTLFISYTLYTILFSILRHHEDDVHSTIDNTDTLKNVVLILIFIIMFALMVKFQHLIKIYREYGLLSVLIRDSLIKVVPFLTIFSCWTCIFAS